jgi:hypothetical protein
VAVVVVVALIVGFLALLVFHHVRSGQQRADARTSMLAGCADHKTHALAVYGKLNSDYPDWEHTSNPPVGLVHQRERTFHAIRTYKFMIDGFNSSFNEKQPYDPEIVALEKRIAEHQRLTANQASEATSERAPGAASSSPQG